jgi:hypothetical protein
MGSQDGNVAERQNDIIQGLIIAAYVDFPADRQGN